MYEIYENFYNYLLINHGHRVTSIGGFVWIEAN